MKQIPAFVIACAAALLLAACSASGPARTDEAMAPAAPGDAFVRANAETGDALAAQLALKAPPGTRILAASFVNRDDFDAGSSMGRLAGAQVATRLSLAGYDVVETRLRSRLILRPGQGEFALSRSTADLMRQEFQAQAVLLGVYTVDREAVFVTAEVVRLDTGAVLAAGDYLLPNAGPVSRMLRDPGSDEALFERYVRDARSPMVLEAGAGPHGAIIPGPERVEAPGRIEAPRRLDEPLGEEDLTALPGFGGQGYLLVPPGRPQQ